MPAAAARKKTAAAVAITLPELAKGERYAGILLDDKGKPSHHLVLLAGERSGFKWDEAVKWAKDQGGELPTRKEQALLFANAAGEFERDWYWSSEQDADAAASAWYQTFTNGTQHWRLKATKLRARAVRRVPIR